MARRDEAADPTRREFFRTFGRETVRNAGAVMGAAAELRQASGRAARELLDLGPPHVEVTVQTPPSPSATEPIAAFNSAYRLSDESLLLLDQRELPTRVEILKCREPSEVASAIRLGVVNAGPITGELAAYAIALAAADAAVLDEAARDQTLHAAANTLRGARRDVRALTAATDRMEARLTELSAGAETTDGNALTTALRQEADAIATEAQLAHAALGRVGAHAIARTGEAINLLMHADMGPLSCGMVGTGTAIVQSLVDSGHSIHIWLTEAAPGMEGTRLAAFQLTQLDVPHTVIPDTAVSWLLSKRKLDGVLLRGDTVGADGETLGPIGSLNVAQLAADAGGPVYVVAPSSSFAPAAVEPVSLLLDLRSPAESDARTGSARPSPPPAVEVRLSPTTDLIPVRLVTAFFTDTGVRLGGSR